MSPADTHKGSSDVSVQNMSEHLRQLQILMERELQTCRERLIILQQENQSCTSRLQQAIEGTLPQEMEDIVSYLISMREDFQARLLKEENYISQYLDYRERCLDMMLDTDIMMENLSV